MDCPNASIKELSELFSKLGYGAISSEETLSKYQDWDLEFAEPNKIIQFCEVYRSGALNEAQKYELGRLLLASLDEAFEQRSEEECAIEIQTIEEVLVSEPRIHECSIRYWANMEVPAEGFDITPWVRGILVGLEAKGLL